MIFYHMKYNILLEYLYCFSDLDGKCHVLTYNGNEVWQMTDSSLEKLKYMGKL